MIYLMCLDFPVTLTQLSCFSSGHETYTFLLCFGPKVLHFWLCKLARRWKMIFFPFCSSIWHLPGQCYYFLSFFRENAFRMGFDPFVKSSWDRDATRLSNSGGQGVMWWAWSASLVGIGLTELQNSKWTKAHPAHPLATSLLDHIALCFDHLFRSLRFVAYPQFATVLKTRLESTLLVAYAWCQHA